MMVHLYPQRTFLAVRMAALSLSVVALLSLCPIRTLAFAPPAPTWVRTHRHATATAASSTRLFQLSSAEQKHAREVFSLIDLDNSNTIEPNELLELLCMLDMDATADDAQALFKYLDTTGSGEVTLDDFLPWYSEAAATSKQIASSFQNVLIGRRTVDEFDKTPVSDDVLRNAVQCAIAAPNRSGTEPWRFIQIGPETVHKLVQLRDQLGSSAAISNMESDIPASTVTDCLNLDYDNAVDWTTIPGWCVVTTKLTPENAQVEQEDFKSTCCAVQNFLLSMWSEGIGTKWTSGPVQRTKEFAELCRVDTEKERVAGCIWYGFPKGGLVNADPKRRKRGVDDVLSSIP
jgi:nitroreductase